MIEIGTLVKYHHDGDHGIVVDRIWTADLDGDENVTTLWEIQWADGTSGHHAFVEFEVIA